MLEDEDIPEKGGDETVKTVAEYRLGLWQTGSSNGRNSPPPEPALRPSSFEKVTSKTCVILRTLEDFTVF
jgi:hypothetical protein